MTQGTPLSASDAKKFILAGNAVLTIESRKTGTHYTFRIRKSKDSDVYFVGLLGGPDNTSDYRYLGAILADKSYVHGRKSRIGSDAPSAKAFSWAYKQITEGRIPESLHVYHAGFCGRCGRPLTVPQSLRTGLGPECQKYFG